ncbi:trypsin-like peptidase domain-containing protein [Photobacterium sp. GJ3]|uniref:serine protease n=1 Tax=Photobacterium sp. GJ3 TaxID=2829502 RepID=UPI001B8AB85A|nr:serine protease [Photobacterium sp. GJ3]QUJ67883.1 trypsin-like peptidase domain-containing protein [Photobacterium sp. GJ3]
MSLNAQFCRRLLKFQAGQSLVVGLVIFLTSCITANGDVTQAPSHAANRQVVIGVPVLLGGFGSAVPITPQLQVTAKHVARYAWNRDVIYHPLCDLALIRADSATIPTWGLIYPDQPVTHLGHSLLGTSIQGQGKYLQDVIDTNTKCLYSLSDAPVMSGMSGGPVFNQAGEVVGITVAIVNNPEDLRNLRAADRYSQFVPATLIFDWLAELGISPTAANDALAGIQVSNYVRQINRHTDVPDKLGLPRDTQARQNVTGVAPFAGTHNTPSPLGSFQTPVSGTFPATEEEQNDIALKQTQPVIYQSQSPPEMIQNMNNDPAFR